MQFPLLIFTRQVGVQMTTEKKLMVHEYSLKEHLKKEQATVAMERDRFLSGLRATADTRLIHVPATDIPIQSTPFPYRQQRSRAIDLGTSKVVLPHSPPLTALAKEPKAKFIPPICAINVQMLIRAHQLQHHFVLE